MKRDQFQILETDQLSGVDVVLTFTIDPRNGFTVIDIFGKSVQHEAEKRITIGVGDTPANISESNIRKEIETAKQYVVRVIESRRKAFDLTKKLSEGTV